MSKPNSMHPDPRRMHKASDEQALRFFQMPKVFFSSEKYKPMSLQAKGTYAILRDRQELSMANGWKDEEGYIYLVYNNKDLCSILGITEKTVIKLKRELTEYGLLLETRVGLKKCNRLYVLKPEYTEEDVCKKEKKTGQKNTPGKENSSTPTEAEVKKAENNKKKTPKSVANTLNWNNSSSRTGKNTIQELENFQSNDTEYSETNLSDTESVSPSVKREKRTDGQTKREPKTHNVAIKPETERLTLVMERAEIHLHHNNHRNVLTKALEALWNTDHITTNDGQAYNNAGIREKLEGLTLEAVDHALFVLRRASEERKIKNPHRYLQPTLLSAIDEHAAADPDVLNPY